jgi:membrane peptidoglycan carboxypeptidase
VSQTGRPAKKAAPRKRTPAASPKRHWVRRVILGVVVIGVLGVGAIALAVATTSVPTPNDVATSEATIVYWADGKTELGRLGDSTRRSVPLEGVPIDVQNAVLAAEDRAFYDHGGVSPLGIGRAVWNNVSGGSTQGGSTITQQYAKNAFLTQDRSWSRKFKEALLAFKLETVVSKSQILEDYLNTIYFGRGAYGIEAASIAYFGVPVSELNASQGAVLASIIKSPSGLAPEQSLPELKGRWAYVLDSMVEQGWLTQQQRDAATFPEIVKAKAGNRLGGQTGFLLNAVTDELVSRGFDETEIQRGGLRITSTFERKAQRAATAAVKQSGPKSGTNGLRIGLAAIRPGTGEVVAMYGGPDFVTDQINNATRQFAQAGSTFKPFALAAALENEVALNSVWSGNSPATINGYTLTNYGDKSYGQVTLLKATEDSINTAYVQMESEIGVDTVLDAALRAGIPETTPGLNIDQPDLTFVLGTASPSGLDMANAYATFAARGSRSTPTVIKQVVGSNGGLLYEGAPENTFAFDSQTADTVTYALNRVVTNGTGTAAQALDRPAAAKTGTTDDNKSAWFVGYTPQLATAVLMAKEDAEGLPVSMSGTGGLQTVTGGSFPAAIWVNFMNAALAELPSEDFPPTPPGVAVPLNCPTVLTVEGQQVPTGCPTPQIVEFGPSGEPIDEAGPTDAAPSPTESIDPATDVPSGQPVDPAAPTVPAATPTPSAAGSGPPAE